MSEAKTRPQYNDKFSRLISDDGRDILMGRNVAYPLLLKILSTSLNEISDNELKHRIQQNIVTLANRRDHILPLSLKFQKALFDGKQIDIIDMLDGTSEDYLSIYCGIIEGFQLNTVSPKNRQTTLNFLKRLGEIGQKELKSGPKASEKAGMDALRVVGKTIAENAGIK